MNFQGYEAFWDQLLNSVLQGAIPRIIAWVLMIISVYAIAGRKTNPVVSIMFYFFSMIVAYIPSISRLLR